MKRCTLFSIGAPSPFTTPERIVKNRIKSELLSREQQNA